MWKYNRISKKWYKQVDSLDIDNFNFEKQELDKIKYYSKCLNGSTYISTNDFNNIYESLNHFNKDENFYVNSTYASQSATQSNPIDSSTRLDYNKYKDEYGFSVKNLFTPNRLIDDSIKNFLEVDIATTEILPLTTINNNLIIDGIRVKNGHRVLVKDQFYSVVLLNSIDPDTYFTSNYYKQSSDDTTNTYIYYNELNGIYTFNNGLLTRTTDLNDYSTSNRYSVGVKLGLLNRDKEFHLSRLKNGYFPIISSLEPVEFLDKHNWILRHKVEYQNIFELRYRDGLNHSSYTILNGNKTIPQRDIFIGQFGIILNYQDGYLNVINNKYKEELYSISNTADYYWICGSNGTLLRMSTYDFSITRIDLKTRNTLKSIKFFDDQHGFLVGDFNTIYWTDNGGFVWNQILVDEFKDFNYNKVIIPSLNRIFIGGTNGFLSELSLNNGEWVINKLSPYKYVDYDDEYKLVDNINDIIYMNISNWNLSYSDVTTNTITSNKEMLYICGDNGLSFFYSLNVFSSQYDSIWIDPQLNIGNIKSATYLVDRLLINSDASIYELTLNNFANISTTSNIATGTLVDLGVLISDQPILNKLLFSNNTIIGDYLLLIGNDSYLKYLPVSSGVITSYDPNIIDSSYDDDKFSKLLFLDYDMASKLNFYTNANEYRLPNTVELINNITISSTISYLSVTNFPNENNWLVYYKDINKEFTYNDGNFSDINKVELSSEFIGLSYTYSINITQSTNNLVDIGFLMPTYYYATQSGATSIGGPGSSYSLYLYEDLMILNTGTSDATVGDVFNLDSDVITDNFMLNSIQTFSGSNYYYFNTNFNQNIITNLINTTGSVTMKNLNRFRIDSNNLDLTTNFNNHPIHYGYNIEDNIISPLYNNKTAYYNMESMIDYNIEEAVLYMIFSNNYIDSAGHIFTPFGGVTTSGLYFVSPPTSLFLDGTSGYLETPYVSDFDLSGKDFTIDINFNSDSFTNPQCIISNNDPVLIKESWGIYVNTNTSISFFTNDYSDDLTVTVSPLVTKQWYNIKVKSISGIITMYLDNVLVGTSSFLVTNSTGTKIQIGQDETLSGNFFDGFIDDIKITSIGVKNKDMVYTNSFLDFGYTPTYNLYSYLNKINPTTFTFSKEFSSMPKLVGLPYGNSNMTISGNTNGYNLLVFSQSMIEEYESIWNNTYLDINVTDGMTVETTEKLLVRDKYIDSTGYYIVKLDKAINIGSISIFTNIDILSRNTLLQISNDLRELNNIQVNDKIKTYGINSYSTLENEIKSKFYTDSYAKILLSDNDIKTNLTGIVYYDYKNELSLNILEVEEDITNKILSTYQTSGKLTILLENPTNLVFGDQVFIEFTGTDPNTSAVLNPQYDGICTVRFIIDPYNVVLDRIFGSVTITNDPGVLKLSVYDPYFNYDPVDIFDVGIDKNWKQSIMVTQENHIIDGKIHELKNIDYTKYRFRLIDGLTLPDLVSKYSWVLEADIENAVIGLDSNNNIVWYTGIWNCGRWFGGTWYSGLWRGGTWYSGNWYSIQVTVELLSAKLSLINSDPIFSKWMGGKWITGTWNNGTWNNGTWYGGTWINGIWNKGTWNDGLWIMGKFRGGDWITGIWEDGDFSSDYDIANWIDGAWNGGDFASGNWYNGKFDKIKNNQSRFGTRATNWRKAIWFAGEWSSGEFHSYLKLNSNDEPIESDSNRNSIWYTGLWNDGNWYGGIAYNMDWRSGTWYNGVLNNINIKNYYPYENRLELDGEFRFNRLSNFWVIDNFSGTTFSQIGSNQVPTKYIVSDCITNNGTTDVYFYESLTSSGVYVTSSNYTGLSCVSNMTNCQWINGVWYNGIFDGDYYNSGQWYDGVFKSGVWNQ